MAHLLKKIKASRLKLHVKEASGGDVSESETGDGVVIARRGGALPARLGRPSNYLLLCSCASRVSPTPRGAPIQINSSRAANLEAQPF
jgi:hypothetical protein